MGVYAHGSKRVRSVCCYTGRIKATCGSHSQVCQLVMCSEGERASPDNRLLVDRSS